MSEGFSVCSHKGEYHVHFDVDAIQRLNEHKLENIHVIMDRRLADLYATELDNVINSQSVLMIEAKESNKSLDKMPEYVAHLVDQGLRRDHRLLAIGGGIIQDITCFLAATMLRGVDWLFYPTTLLAQADSCIGSKSSINCGDAKNILGTFTPPCEVHVSTRFLDTLHEADLRSGVGEMLKVHAIAGPGRRDEIAAHYAKLFGDPSTMEHYIHASLMIKKGYIEEDEFDQGSRNVFNYGHSFGHAIEAATQFGIPHGIAVTIGMDMANFISAKLGVGTDTYFQVSHDCLKQNYRGFERHDIPTTLFLAALSKDKKNVGAGTATLILPDIDGQIFKGMYPLDTAFRELCQTYFDEVRSA